MPPMMTLEIPLPRGHLGDRVRAVRAARNMSQAELARRVGISKNAMNQIEQGHSPNPRANVIRRLAEVLMIPADYLLGVGEGAC
jgi:transcriptional regulator with XRE-family HTH domain